MQRRFLVLAVAVVAAATSGCASLGVGEPIEVHLVAVTPLPSTAFEHRVRLDLRLQNPNNHAYDIEGLRFVLDVNGKRLASGVSHESAVLPRLGDVVVPVTTTTSLLDLVNQIVAFGQQQQPRFEYELKGKIFLAHSWGSISFDRKGGDADMIPQRPPANPTPQR